MEHIFKPNKHRIQDTDKERSVVQLLTELSSKLCEQIEIDSSTEKRKLVNKLRSCAFETLLFKKNHSDFVTEKDEDLDDNIIGKLVDVVYFNNLQNSSWSPQKNKELLAVVGRLSSLLEVNPQLKSTLVFLLYMSQSADTSHELDSSKAKTDLAVHDDIFDLQKSSNKMRKSSAKSLNDRSYKKFSSSIFDVDFSTKTNKALKNRSFSFNAPFDAEPGSKLKFFEKYSSIWCSQNKNNYQRISSQSAPKINPLCIPQLNLDIPRSLTVPSFRSSHLDEGYVTPDKEFIDTSSRSSNSVFPNKENSVLNPWNTMSLESLSKPLHWTWENLGEPDSQLEPPFLSQSDVTVFECWKKHRLNSVPLGEESSETTLVERNIPHDELFRDIKYLLIGVETKTFFFNEERKSFMIEPGTAIVGLTSEALSVYIEDFLECGNNVRLLTLLLNNSKHNINYTKQGLVFEAMCSSLSSWLQAYRGMVVKIEEKLHLLKLRCWLQPLRLQLRFIANFCCPPSTRVVLEEHCPLPSGGELLTYIYNAAQMTAFSEISFVLYHFLESCLNVYYRFIEKWLFEGVSEDQYGEFFIETRNNFESTLDRSYWRKAFFLNYEKVPAFLTDLCEKIFICGKSLNLVKLCAPNDPLCKRLEIFYPPMTPCLEEVTLERLTSDYHEFVTVCKPDCGINPLQSPGSPTDEKKAAFLINVKIQRDKSMQRIKEAQEEDRRNKFEEKKKIFDIMKKEMEDAEKRKIETRRKQLAEEQERLEQLAQSALRDAARENEEKRRLIEYYKSISDLTEIRRQRAKWKVQRLNLNEKRLLYLADEKKMLGDELLKQKMSDEVDNRRKSCIFKLDETSQETEKNEDDIIISSVVSSSTIDSNRIEDEAECSPIAVDLCEKDSESEEWRTTCVSESPSIESYGTAVSKTLSESSSLGEITSLNRVGENKAFVNINSIVSSTSLIEETTKELSEFCKELECDSEEKSDSKKLYELYNVAHSEALRNKMKVLEFEFDLKSSRAVNDQYYEKSEESRNKERVLEMKLSTNSEAIRERTLELEHACMKAADARKEAAKNKSKVMHGEYNIISHYDSEEKNEHHRKDRIDSHNRMISEKEKESSTESGMSIPNEEKTDSHGPDVDLKTSNNDLGSVKPSKCMSSRYFNSDGRFIFDSIPLVVDITDRLLKTEQKSEVDVQKMDLSAIHYSLHKSVSIPTEIQHVFANDAVLRLFLTNEKLLDHLECIRKYFFLLDGDYGKILTRSIFLELELAEQPSVLLSRHRLNGILQMASNSFYTDSSMADRLSFFVKEVPLAFLLTDPEVLNCLSMKYKLHWPLNIILSEDAILNYDRIFAFQLQLHRAIWVLQQDIQILKIKGMIKSSHYRQIFRHTMYQFIRTFTNYVTTIALEDSWLEFKQSLVKVNTLDALYMAHVKYVKMVNFRCLLNKRSQPLQKQLSELLRTILTFHELLRNGEWIFDSNENNHTHSAFPRLSHQFSVFVHVAKFLVKYVKQLVCKGYQPHFDLLLTYLSGNNFYE